MVKLPTSWLHEKEQEAVGRVGNQCRAAQWGVDNWGGGWEGEEAGRGRSQEAGGPGGLWPWQELTQPLLPGTHATLWCLETNWLLKQDLNSKYLNRLMPNIWGETTPDQSVRPDTALWVSWFKIIEKWPNVFILVVSIEWKKSLCPAFKYRCIIDWAARVQNRKKVRKNTKWDISIQWGLNTIGWQLLPWLTQCGALYNRVVRCGEPPLPSPLYQNVN